MRRELAIALRARVTWLAAAAAALIVGHGLVLATDLYSAASRSALDNLLMRRELDPLAGIVRPTLGGAQLATTILAPVLAARLLEGVAERHLGRRVPRHHAAHLVRRDVRLQSDRQNLLRVTERVPATADLRTHRLHRATP